MRRLLAAFACSTALLAAQEARPMPRTTDGKPDFTGVWQGGSNRRGTWEQANTGLGVGGTGGAAPAPTPRVVPEPAPYQDWAAQRVLESFNRRGIDDPTAICLPPGLPRTTLIGLFPLQIVQTPKQVIVLYEYMNVFRVIPLDSKHPEDIEPTYMGNSVAHWEGDTLVVDVVGFNDKTWLQGTGTFHSEDLHIVERYTPLDSDIIRYEVTMEDPKVLTKPWVIRSSLARREGTRVREYTCAENNEDVLRYQELLRNESVFRRK